MRRRGLVQCGRHGKWRDERHLYQNGDGIYVCLPPGCQLSQGRDPVPKGKGKSNVTPKGKSAGEGKQSLPWYSVGPSDPIPVSHPPQDIDDIPRWSGKGAPPSGKGSHLKGMVDGSVGKGDVSKGKNSLPPPAAALPWQTWPVECWSCGCPGHSRADCPSARASSPFPTPPLDSCLECGTPGHSRRQCPILIRGSDGSAAIRLCTLHDTVRSVHSLIWCPTLGGWRCALYCPCQ